MAYNLRIEEEADIKKIPSARVRRKDIVNIFRAIQELYNSHIIIDPKGNYTTVKIPRAVKTQDQISAVKSKLKQKKVNINGLSLVFGDDYIQYELVEEHLLKKINYFSELSGNKTLSISYTPLFNKDELLENLMLVVDDITEKEKLEAEVVSEKESNQKNIAIITEMAKAEIDDLEIFLDNAKGILQKSMILAKSTPNEEISYMN